MKKLSVFLLFFFSFVVFAQDEVELIQSRAKAWAIRKDIMMNEPTHIRYMTYIWDLSEHGQDMIGLAYDAAKRGKKVQIVVDGMMQGLAHEYAIMEALRRAGVEIKVFAPIVRDPMNLNTRTHKKGLIGTVEKLDGGRNTGHHYYDEFIDTEVLAKGSQVKIAQEHFDELFNSDRVKDPLKLATENQVQEAQKLAEEWASRAKQTQISTFKRRYMKVDSITYVADPPDMKEKIKNGINVKLIEFIDNTQKELTIINAFPYFPKKTQDALKRALARGVKIRIGGNKKEVATFLTGMAWNKKKEEYVKMGIEVFESNRYVHSKVMVSDGKVSFVGSANQDMRSFYKNLENGNFIVSEEFARKLERNNSRFINYFMNKVEKQMEKPTAAGKATDCVSKGLRNLIVNSLYPHL